MEEDKIYCTTPEGFNKGIEEGRNIWRSDNK